MKDLFLLDPSVTFLNHGSFGACPRSVFRELVHWQRRIERQPAEFMQNELPPLLELARKMLAELCSSTDRDIALIPSTTFGVNAVARSIKLKPGDEILLTDQEYGACERIWRYVCAQTGAKLVIAEIPVPLDNAHQVVSTIRASLSSATKVLFVSHISCQTGLILPLQELVELAHQREILIVVDGAHAPGHIDIGLSRLNPDFYIGACHKWLGAPKGTAFLYVHPSKQYLMEPLVVGWGYAPGRQSASKFLDHFGWMGLRDFAPLCAVSKAIDFLVEVNWPKARELCHERACKLMHGLEKICGLKALYPAHSEFFQLMFSLGFHRWVDPFFLARELYRQYKIQVMPVLPKGHAGLRFTVHLYNDESELAKLPFAISKVLDEHFS